MTQTNPEIRHRWARLDGVDLLRGLAILLVLLNHVNMRLVIEHVPYAAGLPKPLVHALVWNGQFGVQIFFAISGFLITSITLKRWGALASIDVRDFYLLRLARIGPLLLALLAVLSVLHFAGLKDFVVSARTGGLGRALLAALSFHVNVLEARRGYLPGNWDVLWSLSVEEMFYLFFPIAAWLLGRVRLFVPFLFVFIVLGPFGRTVLAHGNDTWQEYSYLGGMDAIALGCLTALVASRTRFSAPVLRIFKWTGFALLVFILGFSGFPFLFPLGATGLEETILAIGACLLIVVFAHTQWQCPAVLKPFRRLGQRSYEVYLTHMFVVFAFFDLFLALNKALWFVPLFFLLTIIVATLLGDFVASFYSDRMNATLRQRWGEGKLGSAIEPATTTASADGFARAK
ncbi:MAG TPA: acyltransferase [Candidatus Sulfotelmatobacter sp.]|nr:acyltransferase [Candidatus Sulfotelmatobacter sp.]